MTWDEIALRYPTTDKSSTGHGYMEFYQRRLEHRQIRRMVEIGVASGGSLQMWRDIWPNAEVWGVEIADQWKGDCEGVTIVNADARNPEAMAAVPGPFDLIVDDASHVYEDIVATCAIFVPLLADGGLYVVEDTINQRDGYPASTAKVEQLLRSYGLGNLELFSSGVDWLTTALPGQCYLVAAER